MSVYSTLDAKATVEGTGLGEDGGRSSTLMHLENRAWFAASVLCKDSFDVACVTGIFLNSLSNFGEKVNLLKYANATVCSVSWNFFGMCPNGIFTNLMYLIWFHCVVYVRFWISDQRLIRWNTRIASLHGLWPFSWQASRLPSLLTKHKYLRSNASLHQVVMVLSQSLSFIPLHWTERAKVLN